MFDRRMLLGVAVLGVPALGALGYAGQTGRIDLFTPTLPEDGNLPPLPGVSFNGEPARGLTRSAFFSGVSLLNVWASWCPDCRVEHPQLLALARQGGFNLYGLAADDTLANASAYLNEHGNPFSRVALDVDRRYQRALKHRGIPQTYVFDTHGRVSERITGSLTLSLVAERLMPAIEKARMSAAS